MQNLKMRKDKTFFLQCLPLNLPFIVFSIYFLIRCVIRTETGPGNMALGSVSHECSVLSLWSNSTRHMFAIKEEFEVMQMKINLKKHLYAAILGVTILASPSLHR